MTKPKSPAVDFLRNLFHGSKGFVELRAIPTSKAQVAKPRREFVTTGTEIDAFVEKYGQRGSQYGVYFGVGKRLEAKDGKKNNVAPLTCLWADVDTVKNGWDTDHVVKVVHALQGPIRPNMVVKSGGGLHLYWLLDKPEECHHDVEALNKRLAEVFGGDNVHDVSRILRLPGSFNNKRSKPVLCEEVYCYRWDRYSFDAIDKAALEAKVVFTGSKFEAEKAVVKRESHTVSLDPTTALSNWLGKPNRDIVKWMNEYWTDQVRYHAPRGYVGVHEAQLITTARLHCWKIPFDEIVKKTMKLTAARMQQDAPEEFATWNRYEEEQRISGMLQSFLPKWDVMRKDFDKTKRDQKKQEKARV